MGLSARESCWHILMGQYVACMLDAGAVTVACSGGAGVRLGGLAAFEAGGFDLDSDAGGLTEKGIDALRTELAGLEAECSEELRSVVHANYLSFIAASQVFAPAGRAAASSL